MNNKTSVAYNNAISNLNTISQLPSYSAADAEPQYEASGSSDAESSGAEGSVKHQQRNRLSSQSRSRRFDSIQLNSTSGDSAIGGLQSSSSEHDEHDVFLSQRTSFSHVKPPKRRRRTIKAQNRSNSKSTMFYKHVTRCIRTLDINVEPVIFLTSMSMGLFGTIIPIFIYWSQCIELFNDKTDDIQSLCTNMTNHKGNDTLLEIDEDTVQMDVATLHMYMRIFRCAPAIVSSIILGAWSDAAGGRKQPLLLAYIGPSIANILLIYCSLVYTKQNVFWLLVLEETVAGVTGAGLCEFATMMSMVTDRARDLSQDGQSEISFRVSLATGLDAFGSLVGTLLASALTRWSHSRAQNYQLGIVAQAVAYLTAVIYTKCFVRETFRVIKSEEQGNTKKGCAPVLLNLLLLAWQRVLAVWDMLTAPRDGWRRLCLNVTVLAVFVELFALDNGLLLLYVKRPPLQWTDLNFTNYAVFVSILGATGKLFVWPTAIKLFKIRGMDSLLIMVGLAFTICSFLLLSISTTTEMIYLVGALQFFSGMMSPGFRGLLPKLVRQDETARMYTAVGIVVLIAPILSSLVFNNIYKHTLHFWPGFAFLIVALTQLVVLITIAIVHYILLRSEMPNDEGSLRLAVDANEHNGVLEWTSEEDTVEQAHVDKPV